jgi:hypothetical protein
MLGCMARKTVIAFAGRRVDAPGSPSRFPASRLDAVRDRIETKLRAHKASWLVSSAACGSDLLAIEVAATLGMQRRIVLPFAPARFRDTSVTDRPGDWGSRFDTALDAARGSADLVILDGAPDATNVYQHANEAILDEATTLAHGGPVIAVFVWDGRPREGGDVTAAFADSARRRRIAVEEIAIG